MSRARPIIGLASLVVLALNTAWAQDGVSATSPILPLPTAPSLVLPAQAPPLQVRLYRLRNAQAAFLADELSALVVRPDVRIVGDLRTNSVIVVSPPAMQDTIANLIRRLDVLQPASETPAATGQATMPGSAPEVRSQASVAVRALGQLLSDRKTLPAGSEIAVMRISPAAARTLEAVMQPQLGQVAQPAQQALPSPPSPLGQQPQPGQQAQEYQVLRPPMDGTSSGTAQLPGGPIRTFNLSHGEATALAQALRSLSAQGRNPGVIVVVPPETPSPPATNSRPENDSR